MPVMNGIEMAKRLGKHPHYRPQMMFVSGFGDIEDRDLYDIGVARKLNKPIGRQQLVDAARRCLLDKDQRWSIPPDQDEGPISELVGQASGAAGQSHWIAFGRGGFCVRAETNLLEGGLAHLHLPSELDTPASIMATVQWIEPQEWLLGLEIRYVDPIGRAAVIRVTDALGVNAFIPRTVEPR